MSHPLVVHCKRDRYDVYCGRPSKWGNPFVMKNESERHSVVVQFENYLFGNNDLMNDLHELKGKVLACYCAPKECHCDILARLANDPEFIPPKGDSYYIKV